MSSPDKGVFLLISSGQCYSRERLGLPLNWVSKCTSEVYYKAVFVLARYISKYYIRFMPNTMAAAVASVASSVVSSGCLMYSSTKN